MTLGERIKENRKRKGLSQEQLAEQMNVSRQAITKWERDGGIPELNNLIALSNIFEISIDELVDHPAGQDKVVNKDVHSQNNGNFTIGYYDIELSGWNDGDYHVLVVGQDKDFLYYVKQEKQNRIAGMIGQKQEKQNRIVGMIGKKYITCVEKLKQQVDSTIECENITRSYFQGKYVNIELAKKEGLIAGFFDFRDDDYRNVKIESITDDKVYLEFGRELPIEQVTKMTEKEN